MNLFFFLFYGESRLFLATDTNIMKLTKKERARRKIIQSIPKIMGSHDNLHNYQTKRAGMEPGALIDDDDVHDSTLRLAYYHNDTYEEFTPSLDEIPEWLNEHNDGVAWLHIQGQPNRSLLRHLGLHFNIHDLTLGDIQSRHQRPKFDNYEGRHIYIVLNIPQWREDHIELEQFNIIMSQNYIITIHDSDIDITEILNERIARCGSKFQEMGISYLCYTILDLVIDQAFPVLEVFGNNIEQLEEQLIIAPTKYALPKIQINKRMLIKMKRHLWPTREVISHLAREIESNEFVNVGLKPYMSDLYDHTTHLKELIDTYSDIVAGLPGIYLSAAGNRLNEIMRTLAVISAIFVPLTFITGMYGMNFISNQPDPWAMPLIQWRYGYPLIVIVMITMVVSMLIFFYKRGWIFPKE